MFGIGLLNWIKTNHMYVIGLIISGLITYVIVDQYGDYQTRNNKIPPIDTMIYHVMIKDLNLKLNQYNDSIKVLNELKSKTQIKYEKKYLDYLDRNIVSDDSITKYISNCISQERHNLYLLH